jgi:sugar-specific transcriptional regulator TrmB
VIRYFGSLLNSDWSTIDYIKVQLKEKFDEIIKNFNTEASVKSLNHPSNWKYIDKVGHMIEEYRHIMRVVSSLEI